MAPLKLLVLQDCRWNSKCLEEWVFEGPAQSEMNLLALLRELVVALAKPLVEGKAVVVDNRELEKLVPIDYYRHKYAWVKQWTPSVRDLVVGHTVACTLDKMCCKIAGKQHLFVAWPLLPPPPRLRNEQEPSDCVMGPC